MSLLPRDAQASGSYQLSNDPRAHFGLGDGARMEAVRVHWIDGTWESVGDLSADQVITLRQGTGTRDLRN